jgi:hypothetical protein
MNNKDKKIIDVGIRKVVFHMPDWRSPAGEWSIQEADGRSNYPIRKEHVLDWLQPEEQLKLLFHEFFYIY